MTIPMPEIVKNEIDLPMQNGVADLTEINGRVYFSERKGIRFSFVSYEKSYKSWSTKYSKMANDFHGKKLKVIIDNDPNYYYMMRLEVDSTKNANKKSIFTLSGTADPYKININNESDKRL